MKPITLALVFATCLSAPLRSDPRNQVVLDILSTPEHPRNSEGSFVTLKSGRIEFYFTQFYGGFQDESPARIAEVHSDDRGSTWSQPQVAVDNGRNDNLMDVSLLRLASGKIALFYNVKKSAWLDCRPYVCLSSDECRTWSKAVPVVAAPGYIGTNNDRAIQTRAGRIIMPVPVNRLIGTANAYSSVDWRTITCWYLSDDDGASWREAPTWWTLPVPSVDGMDEPGVVELADGTLFSWARTDHGEQWACRSEDGGEHWSPPVPTELKTPTAPASIKRVPNSSALLAIYNDHSGRFSFPFGKKQSEGRTPLVAAVSFDGGWTWPARKLLEEDPEFNYHYIAIHFVDDAALLGYSFNRRGTAHQGNLRIRRIALSWFPQTATSLSD